MVVYISNCPQPNRCDPLPIGYTLRYLIKFRLYRELERRCSRDAVKPRPFNWRRMFILDSQGISFLVSKNLHRVLGFISGVKSGLIKVPQGIRFIERVGWIKTVG